MNDITADPDRQTGVCLGMRLDQSNQRMTSTKVFSAVLLSCVWGSGWDQLLRAITKHMVLHVTIA